MDAVYRAEEFSQHIELDSFMKEVLYGYADGEKTLQFLSTESNTLALKARDEILRAGKTSVICPECGTHPTVMMTPKGERTITSCKCGLIFDGEINF